MIERKISLHQIPQRPRIFGLFPMTNQFISHYMIIVEPGHSVAFNSEKNMIAGYRAA